MREGSTKSPVFRPDFPNLPFPPSARASLGPVTAFALAGEFVRECAAIAGGHG